MYRLRSRNSILEMVVTHFKLSIPGPLPLLTLSTPTATDDTDNNTMAPTATTTSIVAATDDDSYSKDCSVSPVSIPAAAASPGEASDDISTWDSPPPLPFNTAASATITDTTAPAASPASSAPITVTDNRVYTQIATSTTSSSTSPSTLSSPQGSDINTSNNNNNNNNPIQSLYTAPNTYTYSPLTSRRTPTTSPTSTTTNNYPITSTTTTKPDPESESLSSYSSSGSSNTDRPILLFKSTQERERDIITDTTYILDTSDAFNPYRKRAPVPGSVVSQTRASMSTGMLLFTYTYYIVHAITLYDCYINM